MKDQWFVSCREMADKAVEVSTLELCVCVCVCENCALWGKVCAHDDPVGNVRFVGNISFPHKEFE